MSESKSKKRRHCPAVGRDITSAECGENRHGKYACPDGCEFDPFATQNYDRLRELDQKFEATAFQWVAQEDPGSRHALPALRRVAESRDGVAIQDFLENLFCIERDAHGQTSLERWLRSGKARLTNDFLTLAKARQTLRVSLFETRRILDNRRLEVVDLLDPAQPVFLLCDPAIAAMAVRYETLFTSLYPLPHYSRLGAGVTDVSGVGHHDPAAVLKAIVAHLGGPADGPEQPRWIASNREKIARAIEAVDQASREAKFAASDFRISRATYTFRQPYEEVMARLREVPGVDWTGVDREDATEGFVKETKWSVDLATPGADFKIRKTLGRLLASPKHLCIEALGAERLANLRSSFEATLGEAVQFNSEEHRESDAPMASTMDAAGRALVPPHLLEDVQGLQIESTSAIGPADLAEAELLARLQLEQLRLDFIDTPSHGLDGRTPRQASTDPALRPKLMMLLKNVVQRMDAANLKAGTTHDIHWLLTELGAHDLVIDAPPRREPYDRDPSAEEDDESIEEDDDDAVASEDEGDDLFDDVEEKEPRPIAPRLPSRPLDETEYHERLEATRKACPSAEALWQELEDADCTVTEDLLDILYDDLNDDEYEVLSATLNMICVALVTPGHRSPETSDEELEDVWKREVEEARCALSPGSAKAIDTYLKRTPQPVVIQAVALGLLDPAQRASTCPGVREKSIPTLVSAVKAAVEILDKELRAAHSGPIDI